MGDELHRLAKLPPQPYTYEVRAVASPAVGSDFAISVPAGEVWRLHAVTATLVTSAVVATRAPKTKVDDSSTVSVFYPAGVTQLASLSVRYAWIAGYPQQMAAAESGLVAVPIVDHLLQSGWRFASTTGNIDVGDQWQAITVTAEILRTPPQTIAEHFVSDVERLRRIADVLEEDGYA